MKTITILLVEDHEIVQEGLRSLIEIEKDFKIIASAQNGRDAVQLATTLLPDIVMMDISMPKLNGFEATKQILKKVPHMKVLILSAYDYDEYVEHAMEIGAKGFLIKQTSKLNLFQAIRDLHKGGTYFSAKIAKRIAERRAKSMISGIKNKTSVPKLTAREHEILQLIAEGLASKQVAAELGISIKTVEKHRQNLMEKLNIHDIAGLTRFAISSGAIDNSIQLNLV